ncbi:cystatin-C-like isoform 1-T3 [Anomaloglossus baeobatrachus]|uniref:cystatin-C-like n=1 Tax=Anomaloglossus baeobatrachus TaxID=238106 RepID=UPI003F4F5688
MAGHLYLCLIVASCLTLIVSGGGMFVGGYMSIAPDREDVKEAAEFAVTEYNKRTNDANIHKLVRVTSASSQVVSGNNYKLKFEIGRTSCRKNNDDNCDLAKSEVSEGKPCTGTVFKSLPPVTYSVNDFSCDS